MLHALPYVTLIAQADFQGTAWSLYTTREACASLDPVRHTRMSAFFQSRNEHYVQDDTIIPNRESVCRLCTYCIRRAHTRKQLRNWVAAMQFRIKYLPYESHFSLKMIRAASRVHFSDISVPPPDEYIYAILHLHMICIYVGRTHFALIQRLRKHITTALAHAEDGRLHQLLRSTNLEDWYIVPLKIVGVGCQRPLLSVLGGTGTGAGPSTIYNQRFRMKMGNPVKRCHIEQCRCFVAYLPPKHSGTLSGVLLCTRKLPA